MRTSAPCWWESGSAAGSRCGAPPHFPPWRRRRRWAAPSLFAEAWRGRGYGSSAHSAATPTRRGRGDCTGTAAFGRPQTPTPMRNPQQRPTTAGTDFGPHTPQRPPPAAISTAPALSALGPMGRRAAASGAMGCSSVSAPPSPHGAAPGAAAAGGCADWPILMSDRESSQRSAGGRSSVPLPARGRGFALPVCGCRAVVGALRPVGGASVGVAWRPSQPDHGMLGLARGAENGTSCGAPRRGGRGRVGRGHALPAPDAVITMGAADAVLTTLRARSARGAARCLWGRCGVRPPGVGRAAPSAWGAVGSAWGGRSCCDPKGTPTGSP